MWGALGLVRVCTESFATEATSGASGVDFTRAPSIRSEV